MIPKKYTLEALFFDFDGVIVDSNCIKTQAFIDVCHLDLPKIPASEIAAYFVKTAGLSRFQTFKSFYQESANITLNQADITRLANTFGERVCQRVIEAPEIKGARQFLDSLPPKLPKFVISGTEELELRAIIAARGLSSFFTACFGSPTEKTEHFHQICTQYGYSSENCLMIGDGFIDYQAAKQCQIPFHGIVAPQHTPPFPKGTFFAQDMQELQQQTVFHHLP